MFINLNFSYLFVVFLFKQVLCLTETCRANSNKNCLSPDTCDQQFKVKQKRYLLYEVNPGEGFNLRRDVYMRIAVVVKKLNEANTEYEWNLVLPPWGPLYHWKSKHIGYQDKLKWSHFFDLDSLRLYIPVIELHEFINVHGPHIDTLYYLQHYPEGWTNGVWEERVDIRNCVEPPPYKKFDQSKFKGWFWGFNEIFSKQFYCLSIQGYSSTLKNFLLQSSHNAIMIDRAEVILHDNFGDSEYWMVRRSMVFTKRLISIGNLFRKTYLNSTDKSDKTVKSIDLNSKIEKKATGGPYISVHLRRRDFVKARTKEVPSIKFAAQQIIEKAKELNISSVFVATDALPSEFEELKRHIPEIQRFIPTKEVLQNILDGGVAIVDQWICSHSRYFIGTYESTFSFRIQEEREILGFPVETTFNRLCGDNQTKCTQPSKWTITF